MRDETTNELFMTLSSTIVLKRKEEILYVLLDFKNNSTIETLVDSRAYVSAIAQIELDRIIQQALASTFKVERPPTFQIQVASSHLDKLSAKTTLNFYIAD